MFQKFGDKLLTNYKVAFHQPFWTLKYIWLEFGNHYQPAVKLGIRFYVPHYLLNPILVTNLLDQSKPGHEHRHSGSG